MFDAKVLIKRFPSFIVPKITVIRHVKPILKLSKRGKPKQSYEKTPVPLREAYVKSVIWGAYGIAKWRRMHTG